jgi:hypothetical protein
MNREQAGRAAELYGRTTQARVEVVRAIADGEYETAIRIADEALGVLGQTAPELLDDAEIQESLPLLALVSALQGDLTVARIAAGRPEDVQGGLAALSPDRFLASYFGSALSAPQMAARRCPHGRATYTGYCLARPPCPPAT